ncbi:MAG: HNH endonuclease signature motif containing protein [Campylobacterota bacterium]|nr:HNH endonuclease signature motif containing protein [Campylobacterota bacterium]
MTHFYKPALFYGFIVRDIDYNLSLSIEGNLFVNSYEKGDFYNSKRILINQLDNTIYPNSATPDVKNLKLFPFRIFFKLLLENKKLSSSFMKEKLIYITKYSDLKNYQKTHNLLDIPDDNYYEKFNSWIINSLVDMQILELKYKYLSINKEIENHIVSLYNNLEYSDMFFDDLICELNKEVADKRVKRDSSLILKVKERDQFRCVISKDHTTFYSKGNPYIEAHHIIPMFQQKNYSFKLDTLENIISLCPNCHREIHFSDNKQEILEKIFKINSAQMSKNQIDLNDFYKMYSCF